MKIVDREYIAAKIFRDTLLNATYTDSESNPVVFGDNFVRILISRWDEIKPLDQNLIHAAAISNGFEIQE